MTTDSLDAPRNARYAAAAVYALGLLLASVIDPAQLPGSTGAGGSTAPLHLLGYAVFALVLGYATGRADPWTLLLAAVVATAYGAGIELLQATLPHRTFATTDAVLNAVGATAGAALWRVVAPRIWPRREDARPPP